MKKEKGFTLVELLATIVVLGFIFGIAVYVGVNVINKSKEKSYQVTINEIVKNGNSYLMENNGRLFFLTSADLTYEYQCIKVENLVDYGYLNDNIINSKVNNDETVSLDDYIYIERDINSKAVTKSIYTKTNPEYISICTKAVGALGNISLTSNPDFEMWSKYKDVTIIYQLKNINDLRTIDNYKFNHNYSGSSTHDESKDTFTNNVKTKIVRATSNGKLTADINLDGDILASANVDIDKIDNIGPVIALDNYTGNQTVRHTVTIPLKVTDFGIGVDYSSFTMDDIEIYVGSNKITNATFTHKDGENYTLVINNDIYNGKIILKIEKEKVFDKLENGNKDISIDTNITFNNLYTITYNANGGSGAPSPTTYIYATSETVALSSEIPTRSGYNFKGWGTSSTATSVAYVAGANYNRNIAKDITLYAVWEPKLQATYIGHVYTSNTNDRCGIKIIKVEDLVTGISKNHSNNCGSVVPANRITHPPKDYTGFGILTPWQDKWGVYANKDGIYYTENSPTTDVSKMRPLSVVEWSRTDTKNLYIYQLKEIPAPANMEYLGEVHTITTYINHGNYAQWSSGIMMIDNKTGAKSTHWGCYPGSPEITKGVNYTGFGVILTGGKVYYDSKCGTGNYRLYANSTNIYYSSMATYNESDLRLLTSIEWSHQENRKYYIYKKK